MEPDCKAVLDKYVRSDSVIACLELTGYTSALLLRNLDSNQIDQIEEFVRHACTVMNPNQARLFLGTVFSSHADKFCFPIGVRMGLMLAVNELKSLTGSTMPGTTGKLTETAVQTDISMGGSRSLNSFINPDLQFFGKLSQNPIPYDQSPSCIPHGNSVNNNDKLNNDVDDDGDDTSQNLSMKASLNSFDLTFNSLHSSDLLLGASDMMSPHDKRPSLGHEINIEHLKQHSTSSAIRLASRQFINAKLVQNRHFRIDMEINPSNDGGPPRITGIFNCHLCREKRDKSTPVRFSIARNRYPVMSNVLSHLKIHFQPLVTPFTGHDRTGSNPVSMVPDSNSSQQSFVKQENLIYSQSDSSAGIDSLSPFNLDHLIMAGGGVVSALGADVKMFPAVGDK